MGIKESAIMYLAIIIAAVRECYSTTKFKDKI